MKTKLFFSLAAATLVCASCSNEELENSLLESIGQKVTITATIEGEEGQTRSTVTDEGAFSWSEGDRIGVYTTKNAWKQFTYTSGNKFDGTLDQDEETSTWAVYPFTPAEITDKEYTISLPAGYILGSNVNNTHAPMVAWFDEGETNFEFKHLGGVIRFTLTNVPSSATQFVLTADQKINGDFVFAQPSEDENYIIKAESTDNEYEKSTTLEFETATETMTFYVPLPTGTYSSMTFSLMDKDNNVLFTRTSTKAKTVVRRSLLKMNPIEATVTVNDEEELRAAIAAGGNVKLETDVTLTEALEISNVVSLNLNGKTLSGNIDGYLFGSNGNLTISNGNITNAGGAVKTTGGTLNMTDCTVTVTGSKRRNAVYVTGKTTAVITGGQYTATGTLAEGEGTDWYGIGITDGTVELNTTVDGNFNGGVTLAPGTGERPNVTITGGSYSGKMYHGLNLNGGDLALNGEMEFHGNGGDIRVYTYTGTINGKVFKEYGNKTFTLDELLVIIGSTTEETTVITPEKLAAAVAEGGSIKLGADVTLTEPLTISNDVILNLNGKTLISTFREACIKSSGTLIISNGHITTVGCAVLTEGGTLKMTECYVTMTGSYWENAVEIRGGATAEITGGEYTATGTLATDERTDWYGIGIVDGTVTLNTTVSGNFNGGVTLAPEGTRPQVTITGGSYSGQKYHGLNMNGGDLILEGTPEFYGAGGDIRVYTLTGTINRVSFGSQGDKTYTWGELMLFIESNKEA